MNTYLIVVILYILDLTNAQTIQPCRPDTRVVQTQTNLIILGKGIGSYYIYQGNQITRSSIPNGLITIPFSGVFLGCDIEDYLSIRLNNALVDLSVKQFGDGINVYFNNKDPYQKKCSYRTQNSVITTTLNIGANKQYFGDDPLGCDSIDNTWLCPNDIAISVIKTMEYHEEKFYAINPKNYTVTIVYKNTYLETREVPPRSMIWLGSITSFLGCY